jgi:REP element-mobilizing transposase RayT
MHLYNNKYRIPSARLQTWDYSSDGVYFITICTKNMLHYFGRVIDQKMELNEIGKLAAQYWAEIPNHFSFVEMGSFVVMPNHMHGTLIINKAGINASHLNPDKTPGQQRFRNPESGSVSSIVGSYKSIVTKQVRLLFHAEFAWQPRFHDHIVRNPESFERIQNYIINNPAKWAEDKFYSDQ